MAIAVEGPQVMSCQIMHGLQSSLGETESGNNVHRHSQALPLIVGVDDGIQKQKEGGGNGTESWCGNDCVKTNMPGLAHWECHVAQENSHNRNPLC